MSFIKDYPSINDRINLIKKQPPINTSSPNKHILYCNSSGGRCDLNFNYKNYDEKNPGKIIVQNTDNNYSILINDGSFITYNGFSLNGIVSDKYYLNEIIFFTPSKNINLNKVYDLEANFIHISEDNQRCLIISLFLIVNDSDEFKIKKYYQMAKKLSFNQNFPSKKNTALELNVKNWNFEDFLPDDKSFFNTILDNGIIGMLFLKNPIEIPQLFINKIINIIGLNKFITLKNEIIKNPPINPPYVQLFYSENLPINPFNNYECDKDCSIKPVPFTPIEEKSNIIVESFLNFSKPLIEGFNDDNSLEPDIYEPKLIDTTKNIPEQPVKLISKTTDSKKKIEKEKIKKKDDTDKIDSGDNISSTTEYSSNNINELTYGFGIFGTALVFAFVLIYIFVIIYILYNALVHTNIRNKYLLAGIIFIIIGFILSSISLFYKFKSNQEKYQKELDCKKNNCSNDELKEEKNKIDDEYKLKILLFGIFGIISTLIGCIILFFGIFKINIKSKKSILYISLVIGFTFIIIGLYLIDDYFDNDKKEILKLILGIIFIFIGLIIIIGSGILIYKAFKSGEFQLDKGANNINNRNDLGRPSKNEDYEETNSTIDKIKSILGLNKSPSQIIQSGRSSYLRSPTFKQSQLSTSQLSTSQLSPSHTITSSKPYLSRSSTLETSTNMEPGISTSTSISTSRSGKPYLSRSSTLETSTNMEPGISTSTSISTSRSGKPYLSRSSTFGISTNMEPGISTSTSTSRSGKPYLSRSSTFGISTNMEPGTSTSKSGKPYLSRSSTFGISTNMEPGASTSKSGKPYLSRSSTFGISTNMEPGTSTSRSGKPYLSRSSTFGISTNMEPGASTSKSGKPYLSRSSTFGISTNMEPGTSTSRSGKPYLSRSSTLETSTNMKPGISTSKSGKPYLSRSSKLEISPNMEPGTSTSKSGKPYLSRSSKLEISPNMEPGTSTSRSGKPYLSRSSTFGISPNMEPGTSTSKSGKPNLSRSSKLEISPNMEPGISTSKSGKPNLSRSSKLETSPNMEPGISISKSGKPYLSRKPTLSSNNLESYQNLLPEKIRAKPMATIEN
jgi:carbonic anhydrase